MSRFSKGFPSVILVFMEKVLQQELFTQALQFFNELRVDLRAADIEISKSWSIDHLCFRCATQNDYQSFFRTFSEYGDLLGEELVNGRPIATFKFKEGLWWDDYYIDLLELPAPKVEGQYKNGFEHIEFVVDESLSCLKNRFHGHSLKLGGLEKPYNSELGLKLKEKSIKFHHQSLESVVRLERNKRVYEAVVESLVLEKFKDHEPLIVGTFPLGLEQKNSDIDILLSSNNFPELKEKIEDQFSEYENFSIEIKNDFLLSRFSLNQIPFEIYCSSISSSSQRAFRHFQVEERLLKLGGNWFREKVLALRREGLKTEPAFAQALNLLGDPYEALEALRDKSDKELNASLR